MSACCPTCGRPTRKPPETPAERLARMPADKHGIAAGYGYWHCRQDCCRNAARRRWESYPDRGRR